MLVNISGKHEKEKERKEKKDSMLIHIDSHIILEDSLFT